MTALDLRRHDATQPWPLEEASVQTIVTSPPYWGLRDYGTDGQLGLERTPEEYVAKMVGLFREARRVLRDDGTLWLNLGDCYANDGKWGGETGGKQAYLPDRVRKRVGREKRVTGLKPKDLVGVPWRVAFALQADGWWLRSDIIWAKPNPMPESIRDRPTRAHEYLFLLSKSERYYYDIDSIREPHQYGNGGDHHRNIDGRGKYQAPGQNPHRGLHRAKTSGPGPHAGGRRQAPEPGEPHAFHALGRNRRSVWTILTEPFPEAHFATFPKRLIEPCIKAGSRPGDLVLDPFMGSGTTALVSLRLARRCVGFDISAEYIDMARRRIEEDAPLFNRSAS